MAGTLSLQARLSNVCRDHRVELWLCRGGDFQRPNGGVGLHRLQQQAQAMRKAGSAWGLVRR